MPGGRMQFLWVEIILGVLFYSSSLQVQGQEFTYFNYNEQNGLPSSEVYQIFQDQNGFIWFATDNGVVRFDGADFSVFNKTNGLADAVVFGIHEDKDKNLWFRSFSGALSIYSKGKMNAYKYNSIVKSIVGKAMISSLAVDSNNTLHFATSTPGKIGIIRENGEYIDSMASEYTLFFKTIDKNQYLIGNRTDWTNPAPNYIVIDGKRFEINRSSISANTAVLSYKFWRGNLYITKDRYMYRYDGTKVTFVKEFHHPIISLSLDRSDHIWIGYMNAGTERYSDESFEVDWNFSDLFKDKSVTTVLEDNEGGFWVSTLDKGAYYIPNFKINNYTYPSKSKVNSVVNSENLLIIGFNNGEINAINILTRKIDWKLDMKNAIMSMYYDEYKKELWVSSVNTTSVLNLKGSILREFGDIKSIKRFCRFPDRTLGGISYAGICKVGLDGNIRLEKPLDFWARNMLVVKNAIYIAGINGLYKTDDAFIKLESIGGFENFKISDMQLLPTGDLFIASVGNGFKIISSKGQLIAPHHNHFNFENVYQIGVDSSVWLATEKGMFRARVKCLLTDSVGHYDFMDQGTGLMSDHSIL